MREKSKEEIFADLIPDEQVAKTALFENEMRERISSMNEHEIASLLQKHNFNLFGDESPQELSDKLFEAVLSSAIPKWELKKIAQESKLCPACGKGELLQSGTGSDIFHWHDYYVCPNCGAEFSPSTLEREKTADNEDMDEDSLREIAMSEQQTLDKAWPVIQNMSDEQMSELLERNGLGPVIGKSHEEILGLLFEAVEQSQVGMDDLGL